MTTNTEEPKHKHLWDGVGKGAECIGCGEQRRANDGLPLASSAAAPSEAEIHTLVDKITGAAVVQIPGWEKRIDGYEQDLVALINRVRLEGAKALGTALKRYDWQLEDSINANDVVCEQIDHELAALTNTGGQK